MRVSPPSGAERDWFKIVNKSDDDPESDTTEIYIYDEIGYWGTEASAFVKELAQVTTPKINLHLNSPGGEIFDGIAIYNALKGHSAEVTVYVDALAASAASFIAQAGDKVLMQRNATMMIHDGIALVYGNEQDMLETADVLSKLSNNVADMYAQRAGGSIEDWRALMRAEVWYNAQEAVDAGLADEVLDSEDKDAEKATNKWDLSIFNYAGRKEAPSPDRVQMTVFSNRAKEAPVGKEVNNQGEVDETPPEGSETPIEAPAAEEQGAETSEVESAPESAVTPAATASEVTFSNTALGATFTFSIAGRQTTDAAEVQRYINSVETSLQEQADASRKAFVQSLAAGPAPKVAASNLEELEKFALELSESQYVNWKKSWDFVQPSAALAMHGTPSGGSPDNSAQASEIADLEAIVAYNRRGGMSEEQLKQTSSYKNLMRLRGNSKES